ncbi:hypothetical protein SISNIDRAFT_430973 [Sistotremastrum niveocremeum HHB9708]|uniref:Chitobiosyldiphosphodolichol beta-mannosyltransferase n=1 Tax=Sistotremastrum niveocremeum HHB9708 TaxID=1314777 RepID=A0A164R645_9AGAM|nr:hypothetical protein SISNIDRAFT_430973 [Sistotremastrum niveocremeum HHB9708]
MTSSSTTRLAITLVLSYAVVYVVKSLLKRDPPRSRSVALVVLGDIGRSPRMMYHAQSFAKHEFETYIIGYAGVKLPTSLLSLPRISILHIGTFPTFLSKLPFILVGPLKVIYQVLALTYTLTSKLQHTPEYIMVQNPPSIPTLAVVWAVSKWKGSKVIIDWHNLGYSILALKLGPKHPLVRIAEWFERKFGRKAFAHLFVTSAMKNLLEREFHLQGKREVLHDRPPESFHRSSAFESHQLFIDLRDDFSPLFSFFPKTEYPASTPFTRLERASSMYGTPQAIPDQETPAYRPDRPALLVSSTSWTADEDFSILLDSLSLYEKKAQHKAASTPENKLPKILMVITGKGPERDAYMKQFGQRQKVEKWEYVRCKSMWLSSENYSILLGSADLGISLHTSSSGVDLPMKVVDMFGCGLPVCALDFPCLDELVKDGVNGLVFRSAEQLSAQLESVLSGFPNSKLLRHLASSLHQESAKTPPAHYPPTHVEEDPSNIWTWTSWEVNWERVVLPLIATHAVLREDQL